MKKIAFICAANIKHMTLISLYTDKFKEIGQKFDIIYIDKYHEVEEYNGASNLYRFELTLKSDWSFPRKLVAYWGFRKFVKEVINKEQYDFLIIWNEFTAFMLEDYLRKRYAHKYCVNIRDENYNHIPLIQYRYKKVLEKSCFNTISSDRFREVFPKSEYLFVQSYNKELIDGVEVASSKRDLSLPIRIMFIGRMSYPETMRRAIEAFANDNRFELWLIGDGCDIFANRVKELHANNIIIHGAFAPRETTQYLANADIIYSLNKENDVHSDTLLPIKLYYAIGRHIPILVYKSSYTYEYAKKYGFDIGITDAEFDRIGDIVFDRYVKLQQRDIDDGCELAIKDIEYSRIKLNTMIEKYITS